MKEFLEELPKLAKDTHIANKKFFTKLKKHPPKNLDYIMQDLHDEEFENTDCLTCGNCCKTTSPIFTDKDIERVAKHLKMKQPQFIKQYLRVDEDDFHVLQSSPCTFLADDNYCMIYDVRPKACKEYPHTNRRKFQNILDVTLNNVEICPAVYNIVEQMKKNIKVR